MTDTPKTLQEAVTYFADREVCFQEMLAVKWPDGKITCPTCGCEKVGVVGSRQLWVCRECGRQFSIRVGTIFEDSALPLHHWLIAIWCVANGDDVSSIALGKALKVTQKTAWLLLYRIRIARQLTHKRM
jgi:transposase-like protein